jgi:hypothetical protein
MAARPRSTRSAARWRSDHATSFADAFGFVGELSGTIDGQAGDGTLGYAGVTSAGGAVNAFMTLSHGSRGLLKVDAVAGQGGTYTGFAST